MANKPWIFFFASSQPVVKAALFINSNGDVIDRKILEKLGFKNLNLENSILIQKPALNYSVCYQSPQFRYQIVSVFLLLIVCTIKNLIAHRRKNSRKTTAASIYRRKILFFLSLRSFFALRYFRQHLGDRSCWQKDAWLLRSKTIGNFPSAKTTQLLGSAFFS